MWNPLLFFFFFVHRGADRGGEGLVVPGGGCVARGECGAGRCRRCHPRPRAQFASADHRMNALSNALSGCRCRSTQGDLVPCAPPPTHTHKHTCMRLCVLSLTLTGSRSLTLTRAQQRKKRVDKALDDDGEAKGGERLLGALKRSRRRGKGGVGGGDMAAVGRGERPEEEGQVDSCQCPRPTTHIVTDTITHITVAAYITEHFTVARGRGASCLMSVP